MHTSEGGVSAHTCPCIRNRRSAFLERDNISLSPIGTSRREFFASAVLWGYNYTRIQRPSLARARGEGLGPGTYGRHDQTAMKEPCLAAVGLLVALLYVSHRATAGGTARAI